MVVLTSAGCGAPFADPSCSVDADVFGIAMVDPVVDPGSARAIMHVGQNVEVCMFGKDNCVAADQRFEFRSDTPSVIAATTDPLVTSPACNALNTSRPYPCCVIRIGRVAAMAAGTARIQGVLFRGTSIQKTAELVWCSPNGPGTSGSACRPLAFVEVTE